MTDLTMAAASFPSGIDRKYMNQDVEPKIQLRHIRVQGNNASSEKDCPNHGKFPKGSELK